MKNENKIDEMVGILEQLHHYVLSIENRTIQKVFTEEGTNDDELLNVRLHRVLRILLAIS